MGSYNPNSPQDIGNEWCPIRDEDLVFSPAVNAFEIGHTFSIAQPRTLQDARFYLNTLPAGAAAGQTFMASVYPAGLEDQSGPVQRVIIPCNAVSVTGNVFLGGNAPTYLQALADPSDPYYAGLFAGGSVAAKMDTYYNTLAYANTLVTKRILGVNLLCTISNTFDLHDAGLTMTATMKNDVGGVDPPTERYGNTLDGTLPNDANATTFQELTVNRMPLGEINPFWSAALTLPFGTSDRQPWTSVALQRFELSSVAEARYAIQLSIPASTTSTLSVAVHYMALEVLYCEEQRVAYGGRAFGFDQVTGRNLRYTPYSLVGVNVIPMRTVVTGTPQSNPVLAAGAYTVVLSSADTGADAGAGVSEVPVAASQYPVLNALRELYTIPGLEGVQVNLPFPTTDKIVGRTFTKETTHILPQLTLHTSGGPLTEVHVYGRQAAAPVWGGAISASQGIINSASTNTQYQQVRFYARRFGATTAPLVFRNQATPTIFTSITVAAFDALPEILDGWKQVDLTFAAPTPSFNASGLATIYEWVSASEVVGSRWEILGAIAPAISGIPGKLINNLAPAPHQLDTATYGGIAAFESWKYPNVAVKTADTTTDATVIFAQNMPTISGFALTAASQTVSGIGIDCGVPAGCIPSGIGYHALTWLPPIGSATDLFTRTSSNSFGTATSGQAYTTVGTATDFNVNGTQGIILPSTVSSDRTAVINVGGADHDLYVDITPSAVLSSPSLLAGVITRYVDANNFYWADLDLTGTANITLRIKKKVAGVTTTIAFASFPEPAAAGVTYRLRAQAAGTALRAKVWAVIQPEPVAWRVDTTDTSLTTGTSVGVYAQNQSVTLTASVAFDNLYSEPMGFGAIEIQRMDALDNTWHTIMLGTDVREMTSTASFNDYEARVGILSSYRIRECDTYNFCGPWSATVTGTLPAPGVFGVGDANGVLIFTSNERYNGEINLAYTQNWESNPEEQFDFREAGNVRLQEMYNRDFVTAFRPLERGGEQFTRTILTQAASVAPKVLEDVFKSLRDMAWDTVPYICVRNELGDRWFATVIVPEGVVRRNRRLQLARITIIETTDTPAAVNPT